MNKDELNIWICEKLMGWERKPYTVKDHDEDKIHEFKTYEEANEFRRGIKGKWNLRSHPGPPNYFTEGWEQVKTWLSKNGFTVVETCNSIDATYLNNINKKKKRYRCEIKWQGKYGLQFQYGYSKDQEKANYEALRQVQPEIEKRLTNQPKERQWKK